ncbi:response regulator [Paenibacillus chibensis]|uniref:Response regulator n=1 Tax=Paenibacillus chibensis TaxID=59846 RepID=A0ABU6PWL7_9BACL|nr:response regulator [Paenibacillus chibensis]
MKANIMIVDDTGFMRGLLREILLSRGYAVVAEGCDGWEAIRLYKTVKPDLVMLDISMPGLDGLSALAEIKKLDPKAKVIICSVLGKRNLVIDAIMAGAEDFIVKPFHYETVTESVEKVLGALI